MGHHTSQTRQSHFKVGSWCVPPCTCMSSKNSGHNVVQCSRISGNHFQCPSLIEFIRSIVQGRVWAVDLAGSVLCSGTRLHSDLVLYSTSKKQLIRSIERAARIGLSQMQSVLWVAKRGARGRVRPVVRSPLEGILLHRPRNNSICQFLHTVDALETPAEPAASFSRPPTCLKCLKANPLPVFRANSPCPVECPE